MGRINSASCRGDGAPVLQSGGQRAVHSGATCANADTNIDARARAHSHAQAHTHTAVAGFAAIR